MSAAHDLLARPSPAAARASIGAETVVELVPPRWRWRVISPGQWQVLSRLGRRARVRDLVPPGGGDVAEVVELVTQLVAAGFLAAEERPGPPVSEPDAPVAVEPVPGPVDVDVPVAEPPVDAWPFAGPPLSEPPADRPPGGALAPGGPMVGPGAWPPIWRDPDRGPAPVPGPPAEPPPWPAPGAHRAEPTPQAHPDEGPHLLPRREPGRALPPASAVLRQRPERVRLPGDDQGAPGTDVLRRLLGGLRQLEGHGWIDRDGAG